MKQQSFLYFIAVLTITSACMVARKTTVNIEWKTAATLPVPSPGSKQPGLAGVVAGLSNDVLLVGGGANFPDAMPWIGGKKKYYSDIYAFEKDAKGNIRSVDKIFHLPFAIAYVASCTTAKGIVCAGGENENGLSKKVLLIEWDAATNNLSFKDLPDLPFAVTNACIAVNGDDLYLAGGETPDSVSTQLITLDLNNAIGGWKQLTSIPKATSNAVMVVQSNGDGNSLYLIGGRKKNPNSTSNLYSTVYQFNLRDNQWHEKTSLPYPLSAGTGLAVEGNNILLFGGDRGETFHKTERLIAAINAEKDEVRKQQLIDEKTTLQSTHPGFSREILLYNTIKDNWTSLGLIPFEGQVTTMAVQWGKDVIIPSGEVKAGVRTPNIISGKISVR
jgi:N-acetylneuraminate epimerase